jgi:hypothetical protein
MLKTPAMLLVSGLVMLAIGVTLFFIPFNSKVEWVLATALFYGGGSLAIIGASIQLIR